jgi:hypothetical protein
LLDASGQAQASNVAAAAPKDLKTWADLADAARLSPSARKVWSDKVVAAYGGSSSQILGLKPQELESLCGFLGRMGDARGPLLAAHYVTDGQSWRAAGSLDDLKVVAKLLGGASERVVAARKLLADHVAANFLDDKTKITAAGPWVWRDLVQAIKGELVVEARASWVSKLRDAYFPTPEATATLSDDSLKGLVACLMGLDPQQAGALAMTRLGNPAKRAALATNDSLDLTWWAVEAGAPGVADVIDDLGKTWLAAAAKPGDIPLLCHAWMCQTYGRPLSKAQEWLMGVYGTKVGNQDAQNSVDLATLWFLADSMKAVGLTGKGKGYPGFAAAVARHVRQGSDIPLSNCETYALALGTADSRQIVEDELLDGQGNPRLAAAKILAGSYQMTGELPKWCDLIEQKIKGTAGDTKALWLAAKGYAETRQVDPPNPWRREYWVKAALAAATSEQVKMVILKEFAEHYRVIKRPAMAADLMESVKGQFGADAAADISRLQTQLRQEDADLRMAEAQIQAARELVRLESRLKLYQDRLAQAQAAGNAEAVGRLTTQVQQLQKEFNP